VRIKKRNLARLASLSTLGAGALGVAAGPAQASIVYHAFGPPFSITPPAVSGSSSHVMIGSSAVGSLFKVAGLHGGYSRGTGTPTVWTFARKSLVVVADGLFQKTKYSSTYRALFPVRVVGGRLSQQLVSAGAKWTAATGAAFFAIANRGKSYTPPGNATNTFAEGDTGGAEKYLLFKFQGAGGPLYGWLGMSAAVSTTTGPTVTLDGWAYDDVGNLIAAGDEGNTVPEPGGMAAWGLAALALGAAGTRRWRTARKQAA
jgi:hypothetical protein